MGKAAKKFKRTRVTITLKDLPDGQVETRAEFIPAGNRTNPTGAQKWGYATGTTLPSR